MLYPVPSSSARTKIQVPDGWTPDQDSLKFVGYLAHLTD